jgi:hypothetical protein
MSKQHGKLLTSLFSVVSAGLLCLSLIACGVDSGADDVDENSQGAINPKKDPSKKKGRASAARANRYNSVASKTTSDSGSDMASGDFSVTIDRGKRAAASTNSSHFVAINMTPGSNGMTLKDFFITAAIDGEKGEVNGHRGIKNGNYFVYDVALKDCCLGALWLQPPANCLGCADTRFAQGKKISFRIKSIPNTEIRQGEQYPLTVAVENRGSHPCTKTQSTTLTAAKASPSKGGKRISPIRQRSCADRSRSK